MESQALDSMTLVRLTPSLESAAVHIIIIIFLPAFENKYLLTSLCIRSGQQPHAALCDVRHSAAACISRWVLYLSSGGTVLTYLLSYLGLLTLGTLALTQAPTCQIASTQCPSGSQNQIGCCVSCIIVSHHYSYFLTIATLVTYVCQGLAIHRLHFHLPYHFIIR